jgi:sensor histidine kinase YesM
MNLSNHTTYTGYFSRNVYLLLAAVISIPVFILTHFYIQSISIHEDEAVATAATACFMAGIFTGRYFAKSWFTLYGHAHKRYMTALAILIVVCVSWLFFHADFPLQRSAAINLLLFLLPYVAISIAFGMLVKMVRTAAQQQLAEAHAGEEHSRSELHLLQSQISPHFLFNTLNNMYGLSITQHEKVPPLLLKLSELLRYSVYDATATYVPLKDELTYINNYIDFEKIRIGERLMLTTEFEDITDPAIRIAPMLLIVFIENAFKHSKNTVSEKIYISISLRTWANSILFSIKNSHSKPERLEPGADKNSGFGLVSVEKRLQLLYQHQHDLKIIDDSNFYQVMLQLKIN